MTEHSAGHCFVQAATWGSPPRPAETDFCSLLIRKTQGLARDTLPPLLSLVLTPVLSQEFRNTNSPVYSLLIIGRRKLGKGKSAFIRRNFFNLVVTRSRFRSASRAFHHQLCRSCARARSATCGALRKIPPTACCDVWKLQAVVRCQEPHLLQ